MVEIPEPVTRWNVGDRVEIISRPESTGATVKEIAKIMRGENVFDISYLLAYDDGGEGWHTEGSLQDDEEETPEEPAPEESPPEEEEIP